jgi:diacylglycerol kinase (CTP)
MILSWADTAASAIGRKYGKYTPKLPSPPFAKRKSLAGTMGAFFFGGLSAYIFFNYAAPFGSENDLTWLGERSALVPTFVKTAISATSHHLQKWTGPSTSFPDYLPIGKGALISTRLPPPKSTIPLWQVELICAVSAALAEGLDIYGLDDNVIMPVLSGLMIWGALTILG